MGPGSSEHDDLILLRAIVENAVDAIITITDGGIILTANPSVRKLFGYEPGELIGQNVKMLMPEPYHSQHDSYIGNYRETGTRKIIGIGREVEGRRKDGTIFPLDLAVSESLTSVGRVFTGVIHDITERKKSEQILIEKEAIEKANDSKNEFLSRMSHELRTPLNAMLGFSQLVMMRSQDPFVQESTQSILKAGKHLLSLIDEVLDLAKIEAGQYSISVEPVPLHSLMGQVLELTKPLADDAQVNIVVLPLEDRDVHVMADRRRLMQVFLNLLSNAIKYNRVGGSVTIEAREDSGMMLVRFTDTGYGIREEDHHKLFQPFERLNTLVPEGSGLGLALSQRFMEIMNGTVRLAASDPSGSKFDILVPRVQPQTHTTTQELTMSERMAMASLKTSKVLYIEDNVSNMKLVEMVLSQWPNVEMLSAFQGNIGIELAKSHLPDLILLDLHLPDTSGQEVLRRLKGDLLTASIPVLIITADATKTQSGNLMALGAEGILTKPIDIPLLIERINHLIGGGYGV